MEEDVTVEVQFRKFGIAEAFTCQFRPKRSHAGKPLRFCETGVSCLRSFLQDRPCITGTEEAKRLFKNYWKQHPANDQEQFVIACLDTKHRVQCVVRITVGTLDASLVHPREVFKPALIEGSAGSYPRPFLSPSTALYRTLTADYAFRIPITFHVPFNGTCDCTADALPSMGGPHHSLRTVLPIDCCGFGPLLGKDAHWAKTFKKGESYGIRYVRLQDSRSN